MSERDMKKLLELIEKHLGKGWIDLADWLRDQNQVEDIEQRLAADDIEGVLADLDVAAKRFAELTHKEYVRSADAAAEWLTAQLRTTSEDDEKTPLISFDTENSRAVARQEANELELVQGLDDEQRENVKQILRDGQKAGTNPRVMARDIRDSIGLAPNQEAAVRSYRAALESGDFANALGRELSDGRSDRIVQRVADDDGMLSEEQIDTMVERYRANFLTHRAETIGRLESLRAAHEGTEDLYRQAVKDGSIDADSLEREWSPGPKTRNRRKDHQAMRGQKRKLGESFVTPRGVKLRYPGDPDADPGETINCACALLTRLIASRSVKGKDGKRREQTYVVPWPHA